MKLIKFIQYFRKIKSEIVVADTTNDVAHEPTPVVNTTSVVARGTTIANFSTIPTSITHREKLEKFNKLNFKGGSKRCSFI